jgi:2-phospho-L-lactate guanylyltransferase (CobY/MobA/RfbA family)
MHFFERLAETNALRREVAQASRLLAVLKCRLSSAEHERDRQFNVAMLAKQETAFLEEMLCQIDVISDNPEVKRYVRRGLDYLRGGKTHEEA